MKAIWNGKTIAESDQTIEIEGNQYFPAESADNTSLTDSATHTSCPWKGEASYYTLVVDGEENIDAAWYYPAPKPGAIQLVGQDFAGYIAFWKGVEITE